MAVSAVMREAQTATFWVDFGKMVDFRFRTRSFFEASNFIICEQILMQL